MTDRATNDIEQGSAGVKRKGYKSPELIALEAIRDIDDPAKIRSNTELSDEEVKCMSIVRATSDWFRYLSEREEVEVKQRLVDRVQKKIHESRSFKSLLDKTMLTEEEACTMLGIKPEDYKAAVKYVEEHPAYKGLYFHDKLLDHLETYRLSLDRQNRREKFGALTAYSKMGMNIRLGQTGSLAMEPGPEQQQKKKGKFLGIF